MFFLRFNCTSPEQECIPSQPDVEVVDNDETTSSKAQAGAYKEFAGLPIGRQQRETASAEQSKQFDPEGKRRDHYFSVERNVLSRIMFALFSLVFFACYIFLCYPQCPNAGTRGKDNFHSRMRERLGCRSDA